MKGKLYHVNEWEDSILLRYQFSLNWSINSMKCWSKYYHAFLQNWQANAKI